MRILHVLDHSLPLHSGYTFRTRAIVTAQKARGMEVACLTGVRHSRSGEGAGTGFGVRWKSIPSIVSGSGPPRQWRTPVRHATSIPRAF